MKNFFWEEGWRRVRDDNVEFGALFHYIVKKIILTVKLHDMYLVLVIYCSENLTEKKLNRKLSLLKYVFLCLWITLGYLTPYSWVHKVAAFVYFDTVSTNRQ